jgi:hypothetical protein
LPCMTIDVEKQTPDYVTGINRGEGSRAAKLIQPLVRQ